MSQIRAVMQQAHAVLVNAFLHQQWRRGEIDDIPHLAGICFERKYHIAWGGLLHAQHPRHACFHSNLLAGHCPAQSVTVKWCSWRTKSEKLYGIGIHLCNKWTGQASSSSSVLFCFRCANTSAASATTRTLPPSSCARILANEESSAPWYTWSFTEPAQKSELLNFSKAFFCSSLSWAWDLISQTELHLSIECEKVEMMKTVQASKHAQICKFCTFKPLEHNGSIGTAVASYLVVVSWCGSATQPLVAQMAIPVLQGAVGEVHVWQKKFLLLQLDPATKCRGCFIKFVQLKNEMVASANNDQGLPCSCSRKPHSNAAPPQEQLDTSASSLARSNPLWTARSGLSMPFWRHLLWTRSSWYSSHACGIVVASDYEGVDWRAMLETQLVSLWDAWAILKVSPQHPNLLE